MDILNRIELKLDALLKCWAVTTGDKDTSLFEVVDKLIKEQETKEEKTTEQLYKESKEKTDYKEELQKAVEKYFEQGKKVICDEHGYFIDNDRVFNIKDNGV